MSARVPWIARLTAMRPSRIGLKLLAFNLLLVFLPVAGILYLDVYETELLDAQERSMVQQGRVIAAALGGRRELLREDAEALLRRFGQRGDARIRVYDARSSLVADSVRIPDALEAERPPGEGTSEYDTAVKGVRQRPLYRLGAWLAGLRRTIRGWMIPSRTAVGVTSAPEAAVHAALAGRYRAAASATPGQRSLTLYSAMPIRNEDQVIGAVLVSQSTFRILQAIYKVRLRIFEIVVASVCVAVVLSLITSATIVRPLVRLRRAAVALADRRATPGSFGRVNRRDEIGDLARTLENLTTRLEAHISLLESFAADVSHEFKNPLASIRTAAEMIATTEDADGRDRLLAMLTRDVDRLERLVSGVRELARIDAQLAHDALEAVDVPALVRNLVSGFQQRDHHVQLSSDDSATPIVVRAAPDRLVQVFENLFENAASFAPAAPIEVAVRTQDRSCVVTVADRGPGIPPAHLERVFERFFSYRPQDGARRDHTGLGLAIARAIVEGYGGSIAAANRDGGGACFEVRLPLPARVQAFSGPAVEVGR